MLVVIKFIANCENKAAEFEAETFGFIARVDKGKLAPVKEICEPMFEVLALRQTE